MFDGNSGENEKPCVEEQYATAVGSSNLRVGNDSNIRTPGDLIAQAGMNKHRMGLALRRLMTEWDSSARAVSMPAKQVEALSRTYHKLPNGLVLAKGKDGKDEEVLPLVRAQREAEDWHAHELGVLFQRLKSLPAVREALVLHAESMICEPGEEGVHLVCAVLQWWLHPTCPTCAGRKLKVIAGTGRTSSKACGLCKGTGERKLPHGWQGRKLLSYMNECRNKAARDLSAGTFAHQRKPKAHDETQNR